MKEFTFQNDRFRIYNADIETISFNGRKLKRFSVYQYIDNDFGNTWAFYGKYLAPAKTANSNLCNVFIEQGM